MKGLRRARDLPGVVLKDIVRYRRALSRSGKGYRSDPGGWISLCNRIERLVSDGDLPGLRCDWTWGSNLHAPSVLPSLARSLMQVALEEWPIEFSSHPRLLAAKPKLSFVFAHAGADRLPQLKRTIRSLYAQSEVPCEIVIVDQSPVPLHASMPIPLTYRHLPRGEGASEFHKAWAYNAGAQLARGSILVFHDGDICAPTAYARELVQAIENRGYAAASLQRFLFYLSPTDSKSAEQADEFGRDIAPVKVFQNWKGGTIAIARDAFFAIGGFDERFLGWGGEDAEFYDRCAEVGHCRSGYLPFVHLWHPPQPSKLGVQRQQNVQFFQEVMTEPRQKRIERLRREQ